MLWDIQWHYVTGNSCQQPGYANYYTGGNTDGTTLPEAYWYPQVADCVGGLNNDGSRPTDYSPEQFWNCAEVTITSGTPTAPSAPVPAPAEPAPTPTAPAPTAPSTDCLPFGTYDEASQQCKCDGGRSPSSQQGRCRDEAGMCTMLMEWNFEAQLWVCPEGSFGTGHADVPVTGAPVPSPTQSPLAGSSNVDPNTFQGCCSNDFKHCITWCGESSETCGKCNLSESFGWIPLTRSQETCVARWAGCAPGQGECCPGLSCQGPAGGWTSCVPE